MKVTQAWGEITPPPTVAAAHRQLIAAVREYADELGGIGNGVPTR